MSAVPTFSERGRLGGAPLTTGSVESADGGTLSSVHIARLRKIAETETGRRRDHLLAAIACIQTLTRKNRRLGAQVGGTMKRKLLTHRGLMLTGKPEDQAQEIAELAGERRVYVYRFKRGLRVTTAKLITRGERGLVGTYDAGCDYRTVLADLEATA